jgi:DnaJ-class molecular chaperone
VVLCDQCHGKKFLADGVMCWKCNGVGRLYVPNGASLVPLVLKSCANISRKEELLPTQCKRVSDQLWERLPYIAAVLLLLFLAM